MINEFIEYLEGKTEIKATEIDGNQFKAFVLDEYTIIQDKSNSFLINNGNVIEIEHAFYDTVMSLITNLKFN